MEKLLTGIWTWPSFLSLTILVCGFVLFRLIINKKDKALALAARSLDEKDKTIESLKENLRHSKSRIEMQRMKIRHLEEINCKMKERDLSLFRSQFSDISLLLHNRTFSLSRSHPEEYLAQKVDIMLKRITGGSDGLGELVNCINKHFDNVLVRLKDDIPNMTTVDFKMFCYYCIGLLPEQIYPLLGLNNASTLYLRKKRLSDKIKTLNSGHRDLYLALLNHGRV